MTRADLIFFTESDMGCDKAEDFGDMKVAE